MKHKKLKHFVKSKDPFWTVVFRVCHLKEHVQRDEIAIRYSEYHINVQFLIC